MSNIDWAAVEAELVRISGGEQLLVDFNDDPHVIGGAGRWFVGDGDREGFGATLAEAIAEYKRQRKESAR